MKDNMKGNLGDLGLAISCQIQQQNIMHEKNNKLNFIKT